MAEPEKKSNESDAQLKSLIVIPTYQEAENIENVLTQVRESAPQATVLVVDDNSPDKTADIAEKLDETLSGIQVLRRAGKSGLGSAYRAGFKWGMENGYDILIEMDADLSHDPKVLPRLIQGIEDGADLVIGSRYIPGGAIPGWAPHRALLSKCGNMYAISVLGLPIHDSTSGYRSYRSSVLSNIDLGEIKADGYGFQIEMAYRMMQVGATIREVPITFIDRAEGKSKMSSRIIFDALGLVTLWAIRDRVIHRNKTNK